MYFNSLTNFPDTYSFKLYHMLTGCAIYPTILRGKILVANGFTSRF